ncbi:MAG: Hsp20/alpha crystallin family protein [Patescibacteria group bacterium]
MSLIKWTPMSLDPFDDFFDFPSMRPGNFTPAMDIWQDEENIYAECPLAGVDPKNVEVSVENDILTVQGKTEQKSEVEEKEYYRKEVRFGSFHRSVALPAAVNNERVSAEFEKGVLKITLPKEDRVKPKKIDVKIKS